MRRYDTHYPFKELGSFPNTLGFIVFNDVADHHVHGVLYVLVFFQRNILKPCLFSNFPVQTNTVS